MPVELNHTIVRSRDKKASSEFLASILGLDPPEASGHFAKVDVANGISLDFDDYDEIVPAHYAFLVAEADFDAILERVKERGVTYYASYEHQGKGEINTRRNGRGFYFDDPNGHSMEVMTRVGGAS
jgi:catechol 2,3-dioxygenase-like lactoylglutathione lyase family enzyme